MTTVSPVEPAMERRLARVARDFDRLKEERDALIVIAFIEGAGVREIARAVGMTHPAVKYILDKHAENPKIVEEQRKRDEYRRTQRFDRQERRARRDAGEVVARDVKKERAEKARRDRERQWGGPET